MTTADTETPEQIISAIRKLFEDEQFALPPTAWHTLRVKIETAITNAVAVERERCAKIADQYTLDAPVKLITLIAQHNTASSIAEEIRAASKEEG